MKCLFVILLMCLTPLQGALAALGVYHSHNLEEAQTTWLFEGVHEHSSHLHVDHHQHNHHLHAQSESPAQGDAATDADHSDHHCHSGGSAFILGQHVLALPHSASPHLDVVTTLHPIDFSESIYRPNWL